MPLTTVQSSLVLGVWGCGARHGSFSADRSRLDDALLVGDQECLRAVSLPVFLVLLFNTPHVVSSPKPPVLCVQLNIPLKNKLGFHFIYIICLRPNKKFFFLTFLIKVTLACSPPFNISVTAPQKNPES